MGDYHDFLNRKLHLPMSLSGKQAKMVIEDVIPALGICEMRPKQ